MKIANKLFSSTAIVGILNVTPDSFSDGGSYSTLHQAVKRAEIMLAEGAQIIDVGGESTRPGFLAVSDEEELLRVIPVIKEICRLFDVPVSVDTTKAIVAEKAVEQGAAIINCVSKTRDIVAVAAKLRVPFVWTHNKDMQSLKDDFFTCLLQDISEASESLLAAGISKDALIVDPGVGFGKTVQQNLEIIGRLSEIKALGFPVMLGASRKSCIGAALKNEVGERLFGTLATTALAAAADVDFVRVHDVRENLEVVRMVRAVKEACNG